MLPLLIVGTYVLCVLAVCLVLHRVHRQPRAREMCLDLRVYLDQGDCHDTQWIARECECMRAIAAVWYTTRMDAHEAAERN